MLARSFITRKYADWKGADVSRSTRSAAVGPPTANNRNDDDLESQAAVATIVPDAVASTTIPEQANADVDADPRLNGVEAQMSVLTFLKIVTALSALYMCANPWLFFYNARTGEICPYTVLCATSPVELMLLTGSRLSAGALMSSLTISIVSKCYVTRAFLHHSWLGAVLDFEPSHSVHTYFGFLSLISALEHAILHCARFMYAKQAYLIYETATGRSGAVGCILLLPIVLPMKLEFLRTKMSFQVRKVLHLCYLPLTVALCFHSITFRYVGSILLVWGIFDRMYFTTRQTFLIPHPIFQAVGPGTSVVFDLPVGYTFKAGSYIYVNAPMISRSEWHPFSIIQVPGKVSRATFYAQVVGDWTEELFRLGLKQPRLPLWITAAQPSTMEKSIYYDNVVLVCTGAGITPAVSIIERFAKTKNIHLLWMSRDGSMVALFEQQLRQVNSTVHITGEPTEETKAALQRLLRSSDETSNYIQRDAPCKCCCHNDGAVATEDMDFGSCVSKISFASTPSDIWMANNAGDIFGDEMKIDGHETDEPYLVSPEELVLPGAIQLWTESVRAIDITKDIAKKPGQECFHPSTTGTKADPVKLVFGRPDIGAYLRQTFATQAKAAFAGDERDQDGWNQLTSGRLDSEQRTSKKTLMKADAKVVKACQQKRRGTRAKATKSGVPIVLYCGANATVEEAIAKTCDELCVKWQKECFGAW